MHALFLLTIIADDSLKNVIAEEVSALGATGYTTSMVEGKGRSGLRNDVWTGENVKIETVVDDVVLRSVLDRLEKVYFEKYPVVAYYHPVNVVRKAHFSGHH